MARRTWHKGHGAGERKWPCSLTLDRRHAISAVVMIHIMHLSVPNQALYLSHSLSLSVSLSMCVCVCVCVCVYMPVYMCVPFKQCSRGSHASQRSVVRVNVKGGTGHGRKEDD